MAGRVRALLGQNLTFCVDVEYIMYVGLLDKYGLHLYRRISSAALVRLGERVPLAN
jgi:hypothetical protein